MKEVILQCYCWFYLGDDCRTVCISRVYGDELSDGGVWYDQYGLSGTNHQHTRIHGAFYQDHRLSQRFCSFDHAHFYIVCWFPHSHFRMKSRAYRSCEKDHYLCYHRYRFACVELCGL